MCNKTLPIELGTGNVLIVSDIHKQTAIPYLAFRHIENPLPIGQKQEDKLFEIEDDDVVINISSEESLMVLIEQCERLREIAFKSEFLGHSVINNIEE